MSERLIRLKVNGVEYNVRVRNNERLLDVLRDKLGFTSVKAGCLRGECGVCTVIMNNELVKSCLVLAVEADGSEILTIEGLSRNGKPSLIQKAFIERFGFQCGFCTPAFILAGHWILNNMPDASEHEIKEVLNSIICRCTGYKQIIDAIKYALELKRNKGEVLKGRND